MTPKYRMLDLFAGRLGWSNAFAARGWTCICVDLAEPPQLPENCFFWKADVMDVSKGPFDTMQVFNSALHFWQNMGPFDFICASSPCEEFSVHGMKHFHPNPKYPENGIRLFNHTREICEASGVPYVMENVRAAQQFVGKAVHHCGPFYLWGTGVPTLMTQGIRKNIVMGQSGLVNAMKRSGDREAIKKYRRKFDMMWSSSKSPERKEATAKAATIPPELANTVADYAERLMEQEDQHSCDNPAHCHNGLCRLGSCQHPEFREASRDRSLP